MLEVNEWMTNNPIYANKTQTVKEAGKLIIEHQLDGLPIVDEENKLTGYVTIQDVMKFLMYEAAEDSSIANIIVDYFRAVHFRKNILEEFTVSFVDMPVVNDDGKLVGILKKQDVLRAFSYYIQTIDRTDNTAAILSNILESAYEGIAVVDKDGILIEFNEAYSRFTGVDRADAIGSHVTNVIENTNLHQTVKTKIPDRGVLQSIQGQDMVVHRIPIWKDGDVIGAIGMLIFEGVTELYHVYERLQSEKIITETSNRLTFSSPAKNYSNTMDRIIGSSEATANLKRMARKSAQTKAAVLISGEKGTGKKMYALSIHDLCSFTSGDFIQLNCGIMSADTLEEKLFGTKEALGLLASIESGTLFLEDIDALSAELQLKLLRVLQNKQVKQLKDGRIYPLNVRLITATRVDLTQQVTAKQFNSDLYHRLSVIHLAIPSLRERKEDIPMLLSHFIKEICYDHQVPPKTFTSTAVSACMQYQWDGNVEEMMHVLEKLVSFTNEREIDVDHLPEKIKKYAVEKEPDAEQDTDGASLMDQIKDKRDEREKKLIISVLEKVGGNKSKAAEMLGVHRTTLYKKLKKFNI
ncbi:sigma 54-interacting transcriptional regulator [Lentibacillus sp. N15]|uniref:sigma 54-interacting transcriptional regulator n=1 Tax=Lentibacillus songyuanensis TaxID=3136161 RepID=UPI0031BABB7A